jgi:hypothetical protein
VLGHGVSGVKCRFNLLDHPISISRGVVYIADVHCDELEQVSTHASIGSISDDTPCLVECVVCRSADRGFLTSSIVVSSDDVCTTIDIIIASAASTTSTSTSTSRTGGGRARTCGCVGFRPV